MAGSKSDAHESDYRNSEVDDSMIPLMFKQVEEKTSKDCSITKKRSLYYEFQCNTRSVKPTVHHFQLRNLVWATAKHDVLPYVTFFCHSLVFIKLHHIRGSKCFRTCRTIRETSRKSLGGIYTDRQSKVSSLAVKDKLLVSGGFKGELVCKHLDQPGVSFCSRTAGDDNAVTNAVEIYDNPSGAVHFTASSNDCGVRDFDMEAFQLSNHFHFPWPVN